MTTTTDGTTSAEQDLLRFPIGRFARQAAFGETEREASIARLAALPAALRAAASGLTDTQLDTPYRPDGWTVRQLVHHVADSHMNAYIRVKLAFTEDHPTIKPYDQDAWVALADITTVAPEVSLALVDGVHARLHAVLQAAPPSHFARTLLHPDNGTMTVDQVVAMYAWHGDHHVAHIDRLRTRMGW